MSRWADTILTLGCTRSRKLVCSRKARHPPWRIASTIGYGHSNQTPHHLNCSEHYCTCGELTQKVAALNCRNPVFTLAVSACVVLLAGSGRLERVCSDHVAKLRNLSEVRRRRTQPSASQQQSCREHQLHLVLRVVAWRCQVAAMRIVGDGATVATNGSQMFVRRN